MGGGLALQSNRIAQVSPVCGGQQHLELLDLRVPVGKQECRTSSASLQCMQSTNLHFLS